MTKQVQRRRGTATQHTSFTGAEGEISVNTTNKSAHVHDGVTAGGFELARKDLDNVTTSSVASKVSGGTISTIDINGGTIDGAVIGGSSAAAGTFTTVTASGDLTIADKIVHSGDTNTAIRFPAADTVTVETSGAERLRVTSAGNVGIGTSSPSAPLDVVSSGTTSETIAEFGNANISNGLTIQTNGNLDWGFNATNSRNLTLSTNQTERMRIDASGNVGIGTSSPANLGSNITTVTINGTSGGGIQFQRTDATAVTGLVAALSGAFALGSITNTDVTFRTNNTERMRITSSGNVLIGTSTSVSNNRLVIDQASGDGANSGFLMQRNGATGTSFKIDIDSSDVANFRRGVTNAMSITSSGNVGIGTSSPAEELHLQATAPTLRLQDSDDNAYTNMVHNAGGFRIDVDSTAAGTNSFFRVDVDGSERLRIDASGNVGIGVTPSAWRSVERAIDVGQYGAISGGVGTNLTRIYSNAYVNSSNAFIYKFTSEAAMYNQSGGIHSWFTAPSGTAGNAITFTQAMTLDASGNLDVGNSSTAVSSTTRTTSIKSSNIGNLVFGITQNAVTMGSSATAADIYTTAALDMRFGTNSTERARIDASGNLLVGKTTTAFGTQGTRLGPDGVLTLTRDGNTPLFINRLTSDGTLVEFNQATTIEGTISVSGTTVSYNGGHLSRWAQFPDNSRPELLKGTVMSNLDQMSNWDNEENEQLNCVQVSTVEGDANVAGVFVAWDSTDDGYNDILLAMTGDMVIRIGAGVTVARGDLLMSAGDGTAKPQGDDIVRSKTIAKVTSTHVSHTYADGSYAVPCVLMAC